MILGLEKERGSDSKNGGEEGGNEEKVQHHTLFGGLTVKWKELKRLSSTLGWREKTLKLEAMKHRQGVKRSQGKAYLGYLSTFLLREWFQFEAKAET